MRIVGYTKKRPHLLCGLFSCCFQVSKKRLRNKHAGFRPATPPTHSPCGLARWQAQNPYGICAPGLCKKPVDKHSLCRNLAVFQWRGCDLGGYDVFLFYLIAAQMFRHLATPVKFSFDLDAQSVCRSRFTMGDEGAQRWIFYVF
jgi:hypothetical protein